MSLFSCILMVFRKNVILVLYPKTVFGLLTIKQYLCGLWTMHICLNIQTIKMRSLTEGRITMSRTCSYILFAVIGLQIRIKEGWSGS